MLRAADVVVPVSPDLKNFARDLQKELRRATERARAEVQVTADTDGFRRQVAQSAEEAAREAQQKMSDSFKRAGAGMQRAGKTMTMAVTAPIVGMGAAALKTAGDYQASMNMVQAVTGATGGEFQALQDQAKELGRTTQFSAGQAGEAMYFLASAGFDTNEVLGAMPGTLQLAASAQMDLGSAADIASNILSGYAMDVEELGRVNDVLVRTFQATNTNVEMLGEAFKYAGPVAVGAGVEFEEAAAAIGLMGNAGIQGSMAGTSLRGALTRLMNPTTQITDRMNALGLNVMDAQGELLPLNEIVAELERTGASTADMMAIFGQRAGPAMAALVSQGSDELTTLTDQLRNSGGTAESVAAVQMKGLRGAMYQLKSAAEGVAIAFAESGIMEGVTNFAKNLANMFTRLAEVNPATLKLITIVAAAAAAIGPLLIIFGFMASAIGSLIAPVTGAAAGFSMFGATVGGVMLTVAGIVAAIAAVGVAFYLAYTRIEPFRNAVDAVARTVRDVVAGAFGWLVEQVQLVANILSDPDITSDGWIGFVESVVVTFTTLWDRIVGFVDKVRELISVAWKPLAAIAAAVIAPIAAPFVAIAGIIIGVFRRIGDRILPFLIRTFQRIIDVISGVFDILGGFADILIGIFTLDPAMIAAGFKAAFGGVWTIITAVFGQIGDLISQAWAVITAVIDTMWDAVWGAIGGPITAAWTGTIKPVLDAIVGFLTAVWQGALSTAQAVWDAVWGAIAAAVSLYWNNVIQPVWKAIQVGIDILVGLFTFWRKMVELALRLIALAITTAWDKWIKPVFDAISRFVIDVLVDNFNFWKGVVLAVWNAIRTAIDAAWRFIQPILATVYEWVRDKLVNAFNFYKDIVLTVWDAVSSAIGTAWGWIRDNVFGPIRAALDVVGGQFTRWKDDILTVWAGLKGGIASVWDWISGNVFDPMKRWVTETLPGAFESAKEAIGRAWDGLKGVVRAPIAWVADNVWNKFAGTVNKLAGVVGMDAFVPELTIPQFHGGGVVGQHGDTRNLVRRPLQRDETMAVLRNREVVLTPKQAAALTNAARQPHEGMFRNDQGREFGGPLSWAKGALASAGDWAADQGRRVLGFVANTLDPLIDRVTAAIGTMAGRFGPPGRMIGGTATRGIDWMIDWAKGQAEKAKEEVEKVALGPNAGWQKMWQALSAVFPNANLHSSYRPGSRTVSGNQSYHARGRAIDVTPSAAIANWIKDNFGPVTRELIYSPLGSGQLKNGRPTTYGGAVRAMHWDHVHWAMDQGGVFTQPTAGMFSFAETRSSRPEIVAPEPMLRGIVASEMAQVADRLVDAVEKQRPITVQGTDPADTARRTRLALRLN